MFPGVEVTGTQQTWRAEKRTRCICPTDQVPKNNQLIVLQCGGQGSEVNMSQGHLPSGSSRRWSFLPLALNAGSWLFPAFPAVTASLHSLLPSPLPVCASVSLFSYKDTDH